MEVGLEVLDSCCGKFAVTRSTLCSKDGDSVQKETIGKEHDI